MLHVVSQISGNTRVSEIVTQHNFTNEDTGFFLPKIFLNLCMEAVVCISDRYSYLSGGYMQYMCDSYSNANGSHATLCKFQGEKVISYTKRFTSVVCTDQSNNPISVL